MSQDFFNFILKSDRAVAFDAKDPLVQFSYFAALSQVNLFGQQFILFGINHWIGVNWNEDLVAFAMDPDAVIEVFKIVAWSELNKDILADA